MPHTPTDPEVADMRVASKIELDAATEQELMALAPARAG
jgi:hypothetical protein